MCDSVVLSLQVEVADEEGSQHKGLHYALQKLHILGVTEPESSHPKWNAFRKAIDHSGLSLSVMKLVVCCSLANYVH